MGAIDDYINDLDGKENLDPVEIAKALSELHKKEYEPVVAKVNQLKETLVTKDQEIANAQIEISRQKALNFDLSVQLPGVTNEAESEKPNGERESGDPRVTIADLFNENVRKHNRFLRKTI